MKIGDLASQTGVTVEALRYYEGRGLLQPSGRRPSGYREYTTDAVGLVRFIKNAQSLGFTLAEVEELVHLRERAWAGDATFRLRDAIVAKKHDINRRIRELRALGDELDALIEACDAACPMPSSTEDCDDALSNVSDEASRGMTSAALDCPLVEALDAEPSDDGLQAESLSEIKPRKKPNGRPSMPGRRATVRNR